MSDIKSMVDHLMKRLYLGAKGELHQVLVADYSIADLYRNSLSPEYTVSNRAIVRATRVSWKLSNFVFGSTLGFRLCSYIWTMIGLPSLLVHGLQLSKNVYSREGPEDSEVLLLCTGVANEERIAKWLGEKHPGVGVCKLLVRSSLAAQFTAIKYLPELLLAHIVLCHRATTALIALRQKNLLSVDEFTLLAPGWLVLQCRTAVEISFAYKWAKLFINQGEISRLYFTMNHACENAFMHALPQVPAGYIEHGFPRRDIPPLAASQYVYSEGYADYLKYYDPGLVAEIIGLDYFPRGRIESCKTIVVATLQNWPQYGIEPVRRIFNRALSAARQHGWRLVFRTRTYDTDAFASVLDGPWDSISESADESFAECLARVRPAMVWTTWSTAVLDATAMGIDSVAFITQELEEYFVTDIHEFAEVIFPETDDLRQLQIRLAQLEKIQ